MELATRRLNLRPFEPSDITDIYVKALNDPSIIGLTEARHKKWNKENAAEFVRFANSKTSILFGVFMKETHQPIGNVRLFDIHAVHQRAELSFLFYDKLEWGKGYATEAIDAVVNYSFDVLRLHRIVADYYSVNLASSKVFEKLGFSREGIFKDHFMMDGNGFIDSIRVAKINSKHK